MKIEYKFADGEIQVVEVSKEIGKFIRDSRRKEETGNRRERYHREFSLDQELFESDRLQYPDPCEGLIRRESREELNRALKRLTPCQRRRIYQLAEGQSLVKIAKEDGKSERAIRYSNQGARKKLKKVLKNYFRF